MSTQSNHSQDTPAQPKKGNTMKALLVVVIALLLLVACISGVLWLAGNHTGKSETATTSGSKSGGGSTIEGVNGDKIIGDPVAGRQVTMRPEINCVFCHSDDGTVKQAPSFKGLYGSVIKYDDGSSVTVDSSVIRFALKHPIDKIVEGFEPRMPVLDDKLNETDKENLIAYLASIGKGK